MRLVLMQATLQLDFNQLLMIPAFLVAGFYGWRRGWREEAITAVGLIFTLLLFSNETIATNLANLINRIVAAFGVFMNALFGGEQTEARPLITADNFSTFQIISFIVGGVASYVIGSSIGKRDELGRGARGLGVLVGVFNAYLILSKVIDFLLVQRRENGDLPMPFELENGTQISIAPMAQTNELRANLPTIFALLFLIVLVITFFRLPKMRQ